MTHESTSNPYATTTVANTGFWVSGPMECWRCKNKTVVTGLLAVPPIASPVDDEVDDPSSDPVFLTEMEGVGLALEVQAMGINPGLRYDYSRTAGERYFMNHCHHCDAKIGDFFVFKAQGPLMPYAEQQIKRLRFVRTAGPVSISAAGELNSSYLDELLQLATPAQTDLT